jgi:hypothetical protein
MVQVMAISYNFMQQAPDVDDQVIAVLACTRGLGLLASASGALTATDRCSELIDQLLSDRNAGQRQKAGQLLLSIGVGKHEEFLIAKCKGGAGFAWGRMRKSQMCHGLSVRAGMMYPQMSTLQTVKHDMA